MKTDQVTGSPAHYPKWSASSHPAPEQETKARKEQMVMDTTMTVYREAYRSLNEAKTQFGKLATERQFIQATMDMLEEKIEAANRRLRDAEDELLRAIRGE